MFISCGRKPISLPLRIREQLTIGENVTDQGAFRVPHMFLHTGYHIDAGKVRIGAFPPVADITQVGRGPITSMVMVIDGIGTADGALVHDREWIGDFQPANGTA